MLGAAAAAGGGAGWRWTRRAGGRASPCAHPLRAASRPALAPPPPPRAEPADHIQDRLRLQVWHLAQPPRRRAPSPAAAGLLLLQPHSRTQPGGGVGTACWCGAHALRRVMRGGRGRGLSRGPGLVQVGAGGLARPSGGQCTSAEGFGPAIATTGPLVTPPALPAAATHPGARAWTREVHAMAANGLAHAGPSSSDDDELLVDGICRACSMLVGWGGGVGGAGGGRGGCCRWPAGCASSRATAARRRFRRLPLRAGALAHGSRGPARVQAGAGRGSL